MNKNFKLSCSKLLLDPFNAFLYRGSLRLHRREEINDEKGEDEEKENKSDVRFDKGTEKINNIKEPLKDWKVVVKDNLGVKSWPMTCASLSLKNFVSTENAEVVESVLKLGAEIVGKGNMDEFGMG